MIDGYRITTNKDEMDLDAIHGYLVRSYWSPEIPREIVARAMQNSLCFAALDSDGRTVGYARVVSDRATYAHLMDVFVLEDHRRRGLSKALMRAILDHPDLQGLRKITLATKDAHGLYAQFGFQAPAKPQNQMEIWTKDIYKKRQ